MIEQIIIGLFKTSIGFLLGWLWRYAVTFIKTRNARRFWKPFSKECFKIVLGTFNEFDSFEPSGFVGLGDAMALAELEQYFSEIGIGKLDILYAERVKGDEIKENLILLGGADANVLTRNALGLINPSIQASNPERHEVAFVDRKSNRVFSPKLQKDSSLSGKDYGVVNVSRNPFSPNKRIVVLYGCFGYGTWGAARYSMSEDFYRKVRCGNWESFELLIEVDVVLKTPQAIRVIEAREIHALANNE